MIFWLCEKLGTLALYNEETQEAWCHAHQTDACVREFVPADREWHKLKAENDRLRMAARVMEKALSDAYFGLSKAQKRIREPRRSILGLAEPLLPELKDDDA